MRLAQAILATTAFAVVVVGSRNARGQVLPPAADALKPPTGEILRAHAHASGKQIYTCDGSKWVLKGPEAKLFDDAGHVVGSHFAGPTWRWSDGSQVAGKPTANVVPDPKSIPWLLLTATSHAGDGMLQNISSIQRLQTKGGKAPVTGCDSSHQGEEAGVSYIADYYFYAPR
jgi:Protein of unknown function (DUF3455)